MSDIEIRYVGGDEYRGSDQGNDGADVILAAGDTCFVSQEKADQLHEDMPHLFEVDGEDACSPPAPNEGPTPEEVDEIVASLRDLSPDQLHEVARQAGVADLEAMRNKDELIDEIVRLSESRSDELDVEALGKLGRPALNELALKAGIESPEALPKKQAVIDEIVQAASA